MAILGLLLIFFYDPDKWIRFKTAVNFFIVSMAASLLIVLSVLNFALRFSSEAQKIEGCPPAGGRAVSFSA